MIDRFLNKNKKLIILCLVVIGIYMVSLFFLRNRQLFCPPDTSINNYTCLDTIKSGFTLPFINLFPYLFCSLLILFLVSGRLKRNAVIAILAISVPIFYFIFILIPVDCGNILCSREDTSLFLRNLYPIITILTLLISAICFHFKDKRTKKIIS